MEVVVVGDALVDSSFEEETSVLDWVVFEVNRTSIGTEDAFLAVNESVNGT